MSTAREALPSPREIYEHLNERIAGQEKAKKVLSVAIHNHYKRIARRRSKKDSATTPSGDSAPESGIVTVPAEDKTLIGKSNVILLGPSGSGKTLLMTTIASFLKVPFAVCDCTGVTEAGYIGGKIENVFPDLLRAAEYDIGRAQEGIVFLDEVDKLASHVRNGDRDVGGRGVQQAMLTMLEGAKIKSEGKTIDTTNILFIASGAFVTLNEIVEKRISSEKSGLSSEAKQAGKTSQDATDGGKYDVATCLESVETCDLIKFGFIPEFIGRFPIIVALHPLSEDMLVQILRCKNTSLISHYETLLKMDECELTFDDAALQSVAQQALKHGTGVRGLRAILEAILSDALFDAPGSDIVGVHVRMEAVKGIAAVEYTRKV